MEAFATPYDVIVLTPQLEEYRAVQAVFGFGPLAPTPIMDGGGISEYTVVTECLEPASVRMAIVCMNEMYNYPCLAMAERLILLHRPQYMFLLGSACGHVDRVKPLDVVVSIDIAYLGRGRQFNAAVAGRPYTLHGEQEIRDMLTNYFLQQNQDFGKWNRSCRLALRHVCRKSLPFEVTAKATFEAKFGVVASDDLVLTWADVDQARDFWRNFQEDAKAYDMESAGFSHACSRRSQKPGWVVVRGVSDCGITPADQKSEKYHLAAAVIAANWLHGFIRGGLCLSRYAHAAEPSAELKTYPWSTLFERIKGEEDSNMFVGKAAFIKKYCALDLDREALTLAILQRAVLEYEFTAHWSGRCGKRTTAIKLDRKHHLWQ